MKVITICTCLHEGHFILQFHHKRQDSMMRNMVNATEVVPRILEYLEDYFDVAYPLPILNIAFLPKYYGPQQDSLGLIFLP
jgi:hydroxymethylglutaryl-CoA reductase